MSGVTAERVTGWPDGAPRDASYLTFEPTDTADAAAAVFERKFGKPPTFIFDELRLLRTGPVPGEEE